MNTEPETGQPKPEPPAQESVTVTVLPDDDDDEIIPHPCLEVYRHGILRGANAGSVMALILGPPVLYFRGARKPREMLNRLGNVCLKASIAGAGLVALVATKRLWYFTDEERFDRAYRLRYNKGQCRADKFTYGGAVIGGIAGAAGYPTGGLLGGLQGASIGFGLSIIAHALTSPKEKEETNK